MNKMNTLWFDVTEIQDWQGHYTGIQRVIFNVGRELTKTNDFKMRYCRYDRQYDMFVETQYSFLEHEYNASTPTGGDNEIKKVNLKLLRRMTPTRVKRVAKKVLRARSKVSPSPETPTSIQISSHDILCVPGAFWTGYLDALERLKQATGPKVIGIIYDLVPHVVPQFIADAMVLQYRQELPKALRTVDHWFAISKNSKQDILNYALKEKISLKDSAVEVIRLGSDIDIHGPSVCPFDKKEIPKRFILFVSTVEARKNHILIYQTVKLAQERGTKLPPVILVGKHGWLADDLAYLLRNDKTISESIRWYERIDDKGLRWLYQNCYFTVYPSHYEGWGLPVAESLAYRKPCVAAHTSSIPEIAGDLIDYFSPYSADELLTLMDKMSNDSKVFKKANKNTLKYKIDTWQKPGKIILKRINTLF